MRYDVLANDLLRRLKEGEVQRVEHASTADLQGFQSEFGKCHDNVARWCALHPDHKPARGWIVTGNAGGALFDKHSLIDRGPAGLLEITPLRGRSNTMFLIHHGTQEEFDNLPNQVVAVDSA
jgi:hypothetical protein